MKTVLLLATALTIVLASENATDDGLEDGQTKCPRDMNNDGEVDADEFDICPFFAECAESTNKTWSGCVPKGNHVCYKYSKGGESGVIVGVAMATPSQSCCDGAVCSSRQTCVEVNDPSATFTYDFDEDSNPVSYTVGQVARNGWQNAKGEAFENKPKQCIDKVFDVTAAASQTHSARGPPMALTPPPRLRKPRLTAASPPRPVTQGTAADHRALGLDGHHRHRAHPPVRQEPGRDRRHAAAPHRPRRVLLPRAVGGVDLRPVHRVRRRGHDLHVRGAPGQARPLPARLRLALLRRHEPALRVFVWRCFDGDPFVPDNYFRLAAQHDLLALEGTCNAYFGGYYSLDVSTTAWDTDPTTTTTGLCGRGFITFLIIMAYAQAAAVVTMVAFKVLAFLGAEVPTDSKMGACLAKLPCFRGTKDVEIGNKA